MNLLDEKRVLRKKQLFVFGWLIRAIFQPFATAGNKDRVRAFAWAKKGEVGLILQFFASIVSFIFG